MEFRSAENPGEIYLGIYLFVLFIACPGLYKLSETVRNMGVILSQK